MYNFEQMGYNARLYLVPLLLVKNENVRLYSRHRLTVLLPNDLDHVYARPLKSNKGNCSATAFKDCILLSVWQ